MPRLPPPVLCLLLVSACSSPPKPPSVDEATRRPANTAMAIDLQTCSSDLQNVRLQAVESRRQADTAAVTLANAAARLQNVATSQASARANLVQTVRFDFGSTQVALPDDIAAPLIEAARAAPLVMLRGRTDGASDSTAEGRVARARAEAVRTYLVAGGVDPARIRTTWQPSGDQVADNASPAGRSLNRRVEVEVYRALPVALAASGAPRP